MTDKLKCCFCGAELNDYPDKMTGARMEVCRNPKCKYDGWHFPVEIIQRMIDGKKAQDALIRIGKILLLDSGKPSVLTVKGKQEIKRIITSTK